MKAATFAWFVNGFSNASEQAVFSLPAMTIKGYQLSLAAGALDWGVWQTGAYAVFDFQALISDKPGWPTTSKQIGALVSSKQVAGTNAPPAFDPSVGAPVLDGALAAAYAIVQQPNEHSNQSIVVPYGGLVVPVPASSYLMFNVAQSGGKGTFAVKMTLYYDEAA
jgi:hypothetical protein